ncbi:hypothetical protein CAEBREN_23153 [Caenorhabditis brenneri]|uniref:BTB domain-containing protein n=1 Tax=Caenorhabditis brenneri TaxID=135651 RepID=G0NS44_CAEBE|nr:hypothetical protein CAEBREN_23153 [Caenorhabditis brenneri]
MGQPAQQLLFANSNQNRHDHRGQFQEIRCTDQFSDMCLEVGTGKFHVAKWLLINQSARFKKMLKQGDLNEIKECENLSKEKSKRSIKDIYRLGNVFEMPEVKFCPKPSVKTETKKRQVRNTEDENEEDDVDGMPLNRRK